MNCIEIKEAFKLLDEAEIALRQAIDKFTDLQHFCSRNGDKRLAEVIRIYTIGNLEMWLDNKKNQIGSVDDIRADLGDADSGDLDE